MKRLKKKTTNFIANVKSILQRPEMAILPGQLAFFFVLAVVPIVTLIAYGASFLNLSLDFLQNFLSESVSTEVAKLITPIISNQGFSFNFIVFFLISFYVASNGAKSIILTSDAIYGVKDHNIIKVRIKAIFMTIVLVVLLTFVLVVPLFGHKIIELLNYVNVNAEVTDTLSTIVHWLNGPLTLFITFFLIKLVYTMAPNKPISSSEVNYGAIFTTILWWLATMIYSYYINHFANFKALYSGLSNIVVLMFWVYILAIIFVWGMALNSRNKEVKLAKNG